MGTAFSNTFEEIAQTESELAVEEDFREILEELEDLPELTSEDNKTVFAALVERCKQRHGGEAGDAEQGIKGTSGVRT